MTGLDIFHLARRSLFRGLYSILRRCRGSSVAAPGGGKPEGNQAGNGPTCPLIRCVALHELHHADNQQNGRPRSAESNVRNAIQQEQDSRESPASPGP